MKMKKVMKKDIVAGLGEIGSPILKIILKKEIAIGYDLNEKLMNKNEFKKLENIPTSFLHVAIPANTKFDSNLVKLTKKFQPECIVIHSTISPGTIERLQTKISVPIIYSATRGVHKRMLKDIRRYTKFFAISNTAPRKRWAIQSYTKKMKNYGVKTKQMSKPETLELAKILCDTSYLGWLINYSQITNVIAKNHGVNYDEMWTFADEIHKILGNRPKMYPGYIGGHCVIPNLELIDNQTLNLIKKMNETYLKKFPKSKQLKSTKGNLIQP